MLMGMFMLCLAHSLCFNVMVISLTNEKLKILWGTSCAWPSSWIFQINGLGCILKDSIIVRLCVPNMLQTFKPNSQCRIWTCNSPKKKTSMQVKILEKHLPWEFSINLVDFWALNFSYRNVSSLIMCLLFYNVTFFLCTVYCSTYIWWAGKSNSCRSLTENEKKLRYGENYSRHARTMGKW